MGVAAHQIGLERAAALASMGAGLLAADDALPVRDHRRLRRFSARRNALLSRAGAPRRAVFVRVSHHRRYTGSVPAAAARRSPGGCAARMCSVSTRLRTMTKRSTTAIRGLTTIAAMTLVVLGYAPLGGAVVRESRPVSPPDIASMPTPPKATHPFEAMRWRHMRRVDENGELAPDALHRALAQRTEMIAAASTLRGPTSVAGLSPEAWREVGPWNIGGRTRALVIDPQDSQRMWAGAVSGGIWSSADGGQTWSLASDWLPNLAIGCLTIDPANPDVIYAGTGEGVMGMFGGVGIYYTTDRGATWSVLPSTANWQAVCRIDVSHQDSNRILAGRRTGGIYLSTDGGATWTQTRDAEASYVVAFDPTDDSRAIAHVQEYNTVIRDWVNRALYSTDGGVTWSTAAGLASVRGWSSRIELAYAPSDPSIVYASVAVDGGVIYKSTDGGASYTRQTTGGTSGASWWANPLWIDPTNPDVLLTGGGHVFRSTDGGVTLQQISNGYILTDDVHPDIQFIRSDPGFDGVANRRVYVCTDGAVTRTDDVYNAAIGTGWTPLYATYRTVQYYGAAGDGPSDLIIGGTQDNGTHRLTHSNPNATLMFGGDGGFNAVDPADPSYCYGEYIFLQIVRSTDGGLSSSYIFDGITDAGDGATANFIAPFVIDLNRPRTMYAGGRSLWRTFNLRHNPSPTWLAIRPPGSANISAIAVANTNSNVVWIGMNDGKVARTENARESDPAAVAWTVVDGNGVRNPFPNRYVNRILIDPDDEQTVYVALGGYSPDNLWKTTDNGSTWTDITGAGVTGLPDVPITGVARHPDRSDWLYVGTDVGVFASEDGGLTWSTNDAGPANVVVDEIVFMHDSPTLLVASHGRGIFTAHVPALPGDNDHDLDVDLSDLARLLSLFGLCAGDDGYDPFADADGDRCIGLSDLAITLANFDG
ncbi:MAG: hypothetical protein D6744_01980 [Planctomycetota bacterium]|nr:MAG: hypothetical protein D6744_01980 [Planctomycetota bacterium]